MLGILIHICNPRTWEVESQEDLKTVMSFNQNKFKDSHEF